MPLVTIARPALADRDEFVAMYEASREWIDRWGPARGPGVPHPTEPGGFERLVEGRKTEQRERFLIRADGHIAGAVGINEIIRGPLQQAFIGYWVAEQWCGRGVGTRGVLLAMAHAFRTLGLHRLEANIQPHNEPSKRLVAKIGMRLEGFSPKYIQIAGEWADHERYAVRSDEFAALHARVETPALQE